MEKHLSEIYARAQKEVEEKTADFWAGFEKKDDAIKQKVASGKMTQDEYGKWRKEQLMSGKHWDEMTKTVATEMLNANKTATAYVNGQLPEIYALNYNALQDATSGIKGYTFELVDAATVRNLATTDDTLLPYKKVNGKKEERWCTQKVNAEVMQGIIQGESIPKIAKRLEKVAGMEQASAIRNARTTTTSAENKGRMDSYHDAEKQGIVLRKRWMATHDSRTREEHLALDGVTIDVDEPFENDFGEIMYPGDPDADPANVYNCRCTLVTVVDGFNKPDSDENEGSQKWEEARREEKDETEKPDYGQDELGHKYTKEEYEDRLKKLNQYEKYHYHATTESALKGIKEDGLVPKRGWAGDGVYMAKTAQSAVEWTEDTSTAGKVVIRVKNTFLAKTDYVDFDKKKSGEGVTAFAIPQEQLEVKTFDGKWIPIKDAVVSYMRGVARIIKKPKQYR